MVRRNRQNNRCHRRGLLPEKETMKRKRTIITDLNVDVLRLVMNFVAKSSDGAGSFARATLVCKVFMELAEDTEVMKAVVFENGSVSEYDESFFQINGLLSKCARAGNRAACNILLTYLEARVRISKAKVTAIKSAMKDFHERMEAVRAVFTRARLKAATLAWKDLEWMINDVDMDTDEITEHLERFKAATNC